MEFPIESQEQFDEAIKERLARERKKVREQFSDYDDLKAQVESGKTALAKAQEEAKSLKAAADKRAHDDEVAAARAKVAKETGVPAELISGDDEEGMRDFAGRLAEWRKPQGTPKVPEPGRFTREGGGDDGRRELARMMFGGEQ